MTKWERFLDIFFPVGVVVVPFVLGIAFFTWAVAYDNKRPIKSKPLYFETVEHDEMKFTVVKHGGNMFIVVRTNGNVAITKY